MNISPIRYCSLWEWAEEADATHTNLLNPTLGRDASHPQLISMSSQVVGCTHQGYWPSWSIPKANNTWLGKNLFLSQKDAAWWVHLTCELMLISCGGRRLSPMWDWANSCGWHRPPWPIPKVNNTWLGKYSFLPP